MRIARVRQASASLAAHLDLVRMASVRHPSKKTRYDIGKRHEDEQPERRERSEERDGCSQRVDNERGGCFPTELLQFRA